MIKFTVNNNDGRKLIGLGLSFENLKRLKEGKPIHIQGEEIGFPSINLIVFSGETEESMKDDLKSFISPQTIINDKKRKYE